jgi:DNA repair protein SbcC/Rad50
VKADKTADKTEKAAVAKFESVCGDCGLAAASVVEILSTGFDEAAAKSLNKWDEKLQAAEAEFQLTRGNYLVAKAACAGLEAMDALAAGKRALSERRKEADESVGQLRRTLDDDDRKKAEREQRRAQMAGLEEELRLWGEVNAAVGSAQGDKFKRFVQAYTLKHLVLLANRHLAQMAPRYRLEKSPTDLLGLQVRDFDMAETVRAVSTLSGGERFLVSLSLALGLSGLEGKHSFVDSLFIDEGFGSLDERSLDQVMLALETLPSGGKRVGVISHVEAMKERIPVQVLVSRRGGGRSEVSVEDRAAAVGKAMMAAAMSSW